MCLGMGFFGFLLFGIYSAPWICKFMTFPNLGSFQPLFLQALFNPVLWSPHAQTLMIGVSGVLSRSQRPPRLCGTISMALPSHVPIPSSALVTQQLSPSTQVFIAVTVFFSPKTSIWLLYFLFLCWDFLYFHLCQRAPRLAGWLGRPCWGRGARSQRQNFLRGFDWPGWGSVQLSALLLLFFSSAVWEAQKKERVKGKVLLS